MIINVPSLIRNRSANKSNPYLERDDLNKSSIVSYCKKLRRSSNEPRLHNSMLAIALQPFSI